MNPHRPRGHILIALMLVCMLISFAAGALILQKPAGQAADIHSALQQAQLAAEGALQMSLANLDAGKPPAASISLGAGISAEAGTENAGSVRQIRILSTGRAPAAAADIQNSQATAQITALAEKTPDGKWRVKTYRVATRLE
ncbi:MAG TPA: hypothetical protein VEK08_20940 [Planctomycetota bacterium]|nr:hypothetical protein [Planctomycetota bacterium]